MAIGGTSGGGGQPKVEIESKAERYMIVTFIYLGRFIFIRQQILVIIMIRTSSTPTKKGSNKHTKSDYQTTLNKKKQQQVMKMTFQKDKKSTQINESPRFVRSTSLLFKGKRGERQSSIDKNNNILEYLNQKDNSHLHKYKQLKNHSKNSDLAQVSKIIEELLNKHAVQRKLSLSQQYILTGYMGKFVEQVKSAQKQISNPFNIIERIHTKNSIKSAQKSPSDYLKVSRSPSKRQSTKKISIVEQKKGALNKQLERIKFIWQMYQLKVIVCPEINKIAEFTEADYHRSMTEIVVKLKGIERNKSKIGEQKSLSELQKVMRNFQQTVLRGLG